MIATTYEVLTLGLELCKALFRSYLPLTTVVRDKSLLLFCAQSET